jgi:L-iditol 2-dehydrogenase
MEALFLHKAFDARVAPFNLRERHEGEHLIKVAAVGLCGSDFHYYKDGGIGSAKITRPFVPGHEFAGWVEEDIPALGLKRGALVAVDPNKACGQCPHCEAGFENLCPKVEFIGAPPFDGAMTGHLWVPESQIVCIPEGMSPVEAVMLEPLGVAIHAVDLAKPRLLETIILLGCGPVGLLILEVLKASGAGDIFVVEPLEHRRAMALKLGARKASASLHDAVAWTGTSGAPLVIEATNSPDGMRDAVLAARIGGRVVLVGIPDGDIYTLPAAEARRRGLKIKFSRRMGHVYPRAIELVSRGLVDVNVMVSHRFELKDAPRAFQLHAENAPGMMKSMIFPNGIELA